MVSLTFSFSPSTRCLIWSSDEVDLVRVLRFGSNSLFSLLATVGLLVTEEDEDEDEDALAEAVAAAILANWTLMSDSDKSTWASAISTWGNTVERGTRGFLIVGGGWGLGSDLRFLGFLILDSVISAIPASLIAGDTSGVFSSVALVGSVEDSATVFSSARHGEASATTAFFFGPRLPAGVLRFLVVVDSSVFFLLDLRGFLPVAGLASGFCNKLRG